MNQSLAPSFDEIRAIQKENSQQIRELKVGQKELQNSQKELQNSQKETTQQIRELKIGQKELQNIQKETSWQITKTEEMIEKFEDDFSTEWSRLIESLVEGKLSRILRERGVQVIHTHPNVKREVTDESGDIIERKEFDIIAVNGKEVVLVEVKTALSRKDVNIFLERYLKVFKYCFPEYKNRVLYGVVAFLRSEDEADIFSEKKGLFVIKATGDSAHIINKKNFKPKIFAIDL